MLEPNRKIWKKNSKKKKWKYGKEKTKKEMLSAI
jgi:hypothetical protein